VAREDDTILGEPLPEIERDVVVQTGVRIRMADD